MAYFPYLRGKMYFSTYIISSSKNVSLIFPLFFHFSTSCKSITYSLTNKANQLELNLGEIVVPPLLTLSATFCPFQSFSQTLLPTTSRLNCLARLKFLEMAALVLQSQSSTILLPTLISAATVPLLISFALWKASPFSMSVKILSSCFTFTLLASSTKPSLIYTFKSSFSSKLQLLSFCVALLI